MKQTKNEVEVQYEAFKNTKLMYSMLSIYIKLLIKIRKLRNGRHVCKVSVNNEVFDDY